MGFEIQRQQAWIALCGGDLEGYRKKYHPGNDYEAIFWADMGYLRCLEVAAELGLSPFDDKVAAIVIQEELIRVLGEAYFE